MSLDHTEEEVDVTYIYPKNEMNKISMNDDINAFHKLHATFLS